MKNPRIKLYIGAAMTIAGIYLLLQMVHVTIGMFSLRVGGHRFGFGMVLMPMIISIVWMFADPESMKAKLLALASAVLIITAIISNVHFYMYGVSLFELIMVLILIFGGAGILLNELTQR